MLHVLPQCRGCHPRYGAVVVGGVGTALPSLVLTFLPGPTKKKEDPLPLPLPPRTGLEVVVLEGDPAVCRSPGPLAQPLRVSALGGSEAGQGPGGGRLQERGCRGAPPAPLAGAKQEHAHLLAPPRFPHRPIAGSRRDVGGAWVGRGRSPAAAGDRAQLARGAAAEPGASAAACPPPVPAAALSPPLPPPPPPGHGLSDGRFLGRHRHGE